MNNDTPDPGFAASGPQRDLVTELYEEAVLCGHDPDRAGDARLYEDAAAEIDEQDTQLQQLKSIVNRLDRVTDEQVLLIESQEAEIEGLRQWKREATEVLGQWEKVYELVQPRPATIGHTKAAVVADQIERLLDVIERSAGKLYANLGLRSDDGWVPLRRKNVLEVAQMLYDALPANEADR